MHVAVAMSNATRTQVYLLIAHDSFTRYSELPVS